MGKKIAGYILLVFSFLLAFASIATITNVIKAFVELLLLIMGKSDAYKGGYAFGTIACQAILCIIIYYTWKQGRKWTRKNWDTPQSNPTKTKDL